MDPILVRQQAIYRISVNSEVDFYSKSSLRYPDLGIDIANVLTDY